MAAAKKPNPESKRPDPPRIEYVPAVEFKVADHFGEPDSGPEDPGAGIPAASSSLATWIPAHHPLHALALTIHTELMLKSTTAEEIDRLVARARERNPAFQPPRYENFLRARTPDVATAHELAAALRVLPSIDFAEVPRIVPLPAAFAPTDTYNAKEDQLDPPQKGINARAAWNLGIDGSGVSLVDLERGYDSHNDLPTNIPLVHGDPTILSLHDAIHGTAVLGIVAAKSNGAGVVGIAPGVKLGFSMRYLASLDDDRMLDALTKALGALQYGDVLLIDDQYGEKRAGHGDSEFYVPVELHPVVNTQLGAIQSLGVVFVEPAGNNSESIDARCTVDSGAIMVGGVDYQTLKRDGTQFQSNFGARVDCHARYNKVVTTGWEGGYEGTGGMHSPDAYTGEFRGTSATAAIVAGAACLLQSYAISKLGYRLSPDTIRTFLRSYGLKSNDATNDQVGIMPDVGECIKNLPDTAKIWMRPMKEFSEKPPRPWGGCPWIVVRPSPGPDPAPWKDLFVTVRADSVDGGRDVYADLYQAPPAFFPSPRDWTPVGRAWIGDVGGGRIQHSNVAPVRWNDTVATAWGGASLIAVVGHRRRSAPERFGIRSPNELQRFLSVNAITGVRTKLLAKRFRNTNLFDIPIVGPPSAGGRVRLEIRHTFPSGTRFTLVMPAGIPRDGHSERVTIPSDSLRNEKTVEFGLDPGARTRFRVEVETPGAIAKGGFELALFAGEKAWGNMFGDLKGTP